ncbi:metalloregulator ArsR/SmtB family transcription factor [Sulfurovum sp. XGS-02]|uniref:ArsR/SmtB family transcription factor n=1 Tax=Sulfurovum sp. XGS-02 TaxID=2925411 RepID=UPI00206F98BA|nr:metalloregulator ArsR/SmtB family transcription factor [Sulfurovum sp. XGS-02]UPT78606.1 metalloregulator ArsR/SmtB family transcription factor [Sulfurovum sp. XGS-02]
MEKLLQISKAFSDLNRIKITALIQREHDLCVCEICDTLDLSQPLVSRHLKQLKEAGILQSHQEGKWIIYAITEQPSHLLMNYLEEIKKVELPPKLVACIKK